MAIRKRILGRKHRRKHTLEVTHKQNIRKKTTKNRNQIQWKKQHQKTNLRN